ncbi:MAG: EI24 domain-containing protein [Pseudomonadota bacterium]
MFRALLLSLGQLGDPAFLKVLAKSLGLTILLFLIGGFAVYWLLIWLFDWFGWGESGGFAAAASAVIIAGLSFWLMFRAVAMGVISIFTDEIVDAVERKHYPDKAEVAEVAGYSDQIRVGLASAGRAIGWNLLVLPLYIVLLVTGIGTVILFIGLNTILLARDLGELIAIRHVPRAEWGDWRRETRGKRMQIGLVAAVLFVIPVANLLAPILSAAMAAHMLHGGDDEDA